MHYFALAPRPSTPPPTLLGAYAHLKRDESVLVTGWEQVGAHEFTVGVGWPAVEEDLPYDPRLLTQTIRQSGLVIAHAAYEVPLTHHTMLGSLDFTVTPGFRLPRDRSSTLDVRITAAETGGGRRAGGSLRLGFHILRGGATVARAASEFRWISPPVYRRVRGARLSVDWGSWPLPEPVDAQLAGRASAADVVLAPGDRPRRWLLRNDTGNHLLFDHPVDHVPGLALLEAAYQAAHALTAPAPFVAGRVAITYDRYVEFDRPCWIEAESLPAPGPALCAVRVSGTQGGERAFQVLFDALER
ncbi:ScbA/BarX family gamma-butyrolactone biosynthesis protein [Streptomyces lushanensis]|uniref:ScbA/BarX family gamma-butyrolactone biosynthesis protein n=1 Tax=Streptomyces lushanensis TaxID=1434255 RepID=UPI000B1AEFE1|nr:ScbA/BarX family gamma-butyrolactone biosynthesis protein [Streptomyces lushanensis]